MTEHAHRSADLTDEALLSSADIRTLPRAVPPRIVEVAPDASFTLDISPIAKTIGDKTFPMLSYNGSIPGPTLRVKQGSAISVDVTNKTAMESTVHWHGLRLENRYDGVPHETQAPIPPGGTYTHRLTFPDAGLFWYHPHMREDYAQEMGLYGNIIVEPTDPAYWPPADRELFLTLDDILIEGNAIAAFDPHGANFTAMGRFGNVVLIGGETEQRVEVQRGEVVRFHLTNTANTRVFKVSLDVELRMKSIGSDGGRYEREEWVDDVVIAPSERALLDVLFEDPGSFTLQHLTPGRSYPLATISVVDPPLQSSSASAFAELRTNADMVAERKRVATYLDASPDKTLALVAEMDFDEPDGDAPVLYVCPMHPEVVADEAGKCPKCGMKLMPQESPPTTYTCPMHPEVITDEPGKCPKCGMKLMSTEQVAKAAAGDPTGSEHHDHHHDANTRDGHEHADGHNDQPEHGETQGDHGHHDHEGAMAGGIEWEDLMPEVNRATTSANMRWKLIDRATGKANADIDWTFDRGEQVKIRLVNEMESDHPMHHPFHIHGERFLVLARDGVEEANLVWKDTVLVRTGEVVDILMDASNPGLWMAHCHIAEHQETGMMFSFRVRSDASQQSW